MQTKYIACSPNLHASMQAAFGDLEVVVDDTLLNTYEFREKELDFAELMEAELEKAERQDADPKDAWTFVVPVVAKHDDLDKPMFQTYLTVRIQKNSIAKEKVIKIIKKQQPNLRNDYNPLLHTSPFAISTIMADLKAALREKDANVLSISEADGLTLLGES